MATTEALFTWDMLSNMYLGANPATPDQDGDVHVRAFVNGTDQFLEVHGVMPVHYAGTTGVTLTFYSMTPSGGATSGNFAWEAAFASITTGVDAPATKTFAAVNTTGAVATNGTARVETISTITFTDGADMDSVVAGESFKLRINRDTGIASNHSGIRHIWLVQLKET